MFGKKLTHNSCRWSLVIMYFFVTVGLWLFISALTGKILFYKFLVENLNWNGSMRIAGSDRAVCIFVGLCWLAGGILEINVRRNAIRYMNAHHVDCVSRDELKRWVKQNKKPRQVKQPRVYNQLNSHTQDRVLRNCPSCRATIRLPNKKGFHSVRCPRCGVMFDVNI